jgi:hypothetical protein
MKFRLNRARGLAFGQPSTLFSGKAEHELSVGEITTTPGEGCTQLPSKAAQTRDSAPGLQRPWEGGSATQNVTINALLTSGKTDVAQSSTDRRPKQGTRKPAAIQRACWTRSSIALTSEIGFHYFRQEGWLLQHSESRLDGKPVSDNLLELLVINAPDLVLGSGLCVVEKQTCKGSWQHPNG